MKHFLLLLTAIFFVHLSAVSKEKPIPNPAPVNPNQDTLSIAISKKYLNIPVSNTEERAFMNFEIDGKQEPGCSIRLAFSSPDYWVFRDVTPYKGKTVKINYSGKTGGLEKIFQADTIVGQSILYKEVNRPQIHYTPRRGSLGDANGLVYYDGEYHMFYQHCPYDRNGGRDANWGHAVSRDLIHWEELPVALRPDSLGSIFSGSTIIDYKNTAGFNKENVPAMVAIYTNDILEPDSKYGNKETISIAYSLDKGRNFIKYSGNPVIDSRAKWNSSDTRDPFVFWHKPTKKWVLVMLERDGFSFYNSSNLKEWTYQSHITGFWECPQLLEMPVDGNKKNTKWILSGVSGTYMIGSFDGKKFTPETSKYRYVSGHLVAAQTFNNIPPEDGRFIQMAPGVKGTMLFPTELTLRTTKEGIRMFSNPIKEIENLQEKEYSWNSLTETEANKSLEQFKNTDCLRIKATFKLYHATAGGINLNDQVVIENHIVFNKINNEFYSKEDGTSLELTADILMDRTSIEVFIDNGAYSYSMVKDPSKNPIGWHFRSRDGMMEIKSLKVYPLKSIW